MINYFLDTSALFKRYIKEAGSDNLASLFEQQARFTIASLTISEVLANLRRLVDIDKLLDDREYARLKSLFLGDISEDDRLCQRALAEGLKVSNPLKQG